MKSPPEADRISLTLRRELSDLDRSKNRIADYLKDNGVSEEVASAVELALYEALINIYDHQPEKFKDDTVSVKCRLTPKKIITDIHYRGDNFDLTKSALPDIVNHFKQGKKRGLGIYFIRTLMDNVEYSNKNGKNHLKLIKTIEQS